jgi:Trypsin-like peptidase domain
VKRLSITIVALLLLAAPAAGDWPPALWPSGGSAATSAANPAVVRIVAPGRDSVSYGSGSLVAKSQQHGLVVTNWHVVNEATGQIVVNFPDGFSSAGTVMKVDRDWDLAAIAIWRPKAEPLTLAAAAPQPGELLTIAGYGSGSYRAASGRCTQYVAPGSTFPFEMVELATTARQGDSGGPILNSRGEIAGVLFGEGQGRTAGSYCGRVQWFLADLGPAQRPGANDAMLAGGAGAPASRPGAFNRSAAPAQPGARVASLAALGVPTANQNANRTPTPPRAIGPTAGFASTSSSNQARGGSRQDSSGWQSAAPRGSANPDRDSRFAQQMSDDSDLTDVPGVRAIPDTVALGQPSEITYPAGDESDLNGASDPNHHTLAISWTDIAGDTLGQQCKTVFATIGGLAVAMHTIGWLSRGSAKKAATDEDEDDDDDDDDEDDDD